MKKIKVRRCLILPDEKNNVLFTEDIFEIEVPSEKNYKKADRVDKEDSPPVSNSNEYYVVL